MEQLKFSFHFPNFRLAMLQVSIWEKEYQKKLNRADGMHILTMGKK